MSDKKKKSKKTGPVARAKKTASVAAVAMALGGIIGVTIGLLKAPKKGSDFKDDVTREGAKLLKQLKLSKKQAETMVKKTLGDVSPETLELFAKAKAEVLARVAKFKGDLTKEKYEAMVEAAMKKVSRAKKHQPGLKKLSKEFKSMYKSIRKSLS